LGLIAVVLSRGLDRIADALKEQPPRPAFSAPASTTASAPAPTTPATTGAAATVAAPESAEARQNRIQEQAEFAFVRQHPDYVRACWKPHAPASGQAPDLGGVFDVELRFDASGLETSRVILSGAYAQPPLLACVKATKLPPLRIPPPGEAVTVTAHMPIP
jgi:hypothetical protein